MSPTSAVLGRFLRWLYHDVTGRPYPRTLHFTDPADLASKLRLLDLPVPVRGERAAHRQDIEELWCLRRYLLALAGAGRLAYPLTVVKGQHPDFMLHWPDGAMTGLEITQATTEAFQRELARTADQPGPLPLDRDGCTGDAPEEHLAARVGEAVARKAARMGRPHWRHADRHDLLLYDNGPALAADLSATLPHLRRTLAGATPPPPPAGPLGRVSLLSGGRLLHDIAGEGALWVAAEPR